MRISDWSSDVCSSDHPQERAPEAISCLCHHFRLCVCEGRLDARNAATIQEKRGQDMHLNGLNLNLLVVLDALLREKSGTHTAERLYVTQHAISVALQRLRECMEDHILKRKVRRVELTTRAKENI